MAKKRRRDRDRQRETRTTEPSVHTAEDAPAPDWRLPSPLARIAGVALAAVTLLIAIATLFNAFADDLGSVDLGIRILVGVLLILLAIVIAALAIAPGRVRNLVVSRLA